jgi:hypothetical protein
VIRLFAVAQAARPVIFRFCPWLELRPGTKIEKMALHRDIYWVGKQWAVTGHGMQAVDQKQKSKFDIEVSRLWDDDLSENLRAERWFNADDFSKGLSLARARYPEPPGKAPPETKAEPERKAEPEKKVPPEGKPGPETQPAPERQAAPDPKPPLKAAPRIGRVAESVSQVKANAPVADEPPPKPVDPKFHLRIDNARAKFVRPWRMSVKR